MIKIFALLYILHTPVLSIIVTDPPSPEDYVYSYSIQDPTTGDRKSQHEVRKGDNVSGAYSIIGPDGIKRTVEYTANPKHGYKAVIKEEPIESSTVPPAQRYRYRIPEKLTEYKLVPTKLQLTYKDRQTPYFVPENEIPSEKLTFENGKFFEPENEFDGFR